MKKRPQVALHDDDSISLNKYISDTGFCSRREADEYIEQLRVTINGKDAVARKGSRVMPGDVVEIDGEPIRKKIKTIYIAFNKPVGVTSTTDTKDKTNIVSYINHKERIFPIGRLDKESEGLIFLTNDGNIVNKILRAGNNHEKEYMVTVDKPVTPEFVRQMGAGVKILGATTKPCKCAQEAKYLFRITLTQGLNRQIRRMCDALDYKVKKLVRIRIMNVNLGKMPVGNWRYLLPEELDKVNQLVAESSKTEEASFVPAPKHTNTQYIPKKKSADGKPAQSVRPLQDRKRPPKKKASFSDFRKGAKKKKD